MHKVLHGANCHALLLMPLLHTLTHAHTHTHAPSTHTYMRTCTNTHTYKHMHAHTHTHTHTHTHMHPQHTHIHAHIHKHIHTHTLAHRKICKNCLCAREEHDVRKDSKDDDQGVQVGKLLFSPTADTLNRRVGGEGTSRSPRFV